MVTRSEYFRSTDGCFACRVPAELVEQLLTQCAKAECRETGGILVGRYSEDHGIAEITAISECFIDSSSHRARFVRGIPPLISRPFDATSPRSDGPIVSVSRTPDRKQERGQAFPPSVSRPPEKGVNRLRVPAQDGRNLPLILQRRLVMVHLAHRTSNV